MHALFHNQKEIIQTIDMLGGGGGGGGSKEGRSHCRLKYWASLLGRDCQGWIYRRIDAGKRAYQVEGHE